MRRVRLASLTALSLALLLVAPSLASSAAKDATLSALPSAKPAEVGLSAERLERIDRVMQSHVDQGNFGRQHGRCRVRAFPGPRRGLPEHRQKTCLRRG